MPPALLALVVAPCIGSFLGVVIWRWAGDGGGGARSRCPACQHVLGPLDMVPLLSFAVLRGRCRHCGGRIDPFHLQVELAALAVTLWAALAAPDGESMWLDCALGWTLLTLAWIDLRQLVLPDIMTLPLLLAGLGVAAWRAPEALADHAAAALLAWTGMAGLAALHRRWRGVEGLGGGDAKLLAAGGAWLGLWPLPWVLSGAAGLTLVSAVVLHLSGRRLDRGMEIPLGPGLAACIWLWWLHVAA